MGVTQHLVFDPANAADSANVGSFVRAGTDGTKIGSKNVASADWLNVASLLFDGAGTALTSTLVSGKQALDVNLASPISVATDVDGFYNVSTNPTPDTVGEIFCTRAATPAITDQIQRVTAGAASADGVVAANVHGQDVNAFGMGYNGTTWDRLKSTSGALNVSDGGGSLTVDATAFDIRLLTTADHVTAHQGTSPWVVSATALDIRALTSSDVVSSWTKDGTGNAIGSHTGALDVYIAGGSITTSDAALANAAVAHEATVAGVSAVSMSASPLSGRKYLLAANNGNKAMYLGTTGVTTATGFPLYPGQQIEMRAGASVDVKVIAAGAAQDMRVLQLS